MKKIIALLVCTIVIFNSVQAISIVEAMQLKGITQCTDRTASNYQQYAPCMYIIKSPRVTTYTYNNTHTVTTNNNTNDNPTTIYNMNNVNSSRLSKLIDTSVLVSQNADYSNDLANVNPLTHLIDTSSYPGLGSTTMQFVSSNGISNLIDTSVLTQKVNDTIKNTNNISLINSTTLSPQTFALPSWFGSGFTSVQSIGDIVLYGRDGQYLAINHNKNQVLFETTTGQIIQYAFTGSDGQTIFVLGSKDPSRINLSSDGINNHAIYIVNNSDVVVHTGSHTVMLVSANDTDNQWGQDVIIAASFIDNTSASWNYVVLSHNGTVLSSGVSTNNVNNLRNAALYNSSKTQTSAKSDINDLVTYTKPAPAKKELTYNINYKLGSTDAKGYTKLISAHCNTNGTVEVLWIQKRIGDKSFGLGIEINNTFGGQEYVVRPGDQICCKVFDTQTNYSQRGGGCEEIK